MLQYLTSPHSMGHFIMRHGARGIGTQDIASCRTWVISSQDSRPMKFSELQKKLKEKDTEQVRYWDKLLKQHELISPTKIGNRHEYSSEDLEAFEQLRDFLAEGADSATAAIRLMKDDLTPAEALERYKKSQREINVLQKKVLDLRRPPWWEQIGGFFKKFWQKIWGGAS